jgi:lactate racemase
VIYRFPYEWAQALDTDTLGECTVYELPPAPPKEPPDLRHSLDHPIGTPPLARELAGARRVLVLVDDLTRDTPQHLLLPGVLDYVGTAGVDPSRVTVLIATGTHRGMTAEEIACRFGSAVAKRYRFVSHSASDPAALVSCGKARDGTPVMVNRLVREHDFVLAVGQIGPHRVAGFSGGAKMILPGVAGEAATAAVHWQGWLLEGERIYGIAENPVRLEMEEVAGRAGLRFVVNAVLAPDGSIHGIFAGDFRAAFRSGAEASLRLLSLPVPRSDIVVVDSHPYDLDFWQACKAISVAELVVRRGGLIVLVTPCPEGLSAHSSRIERLGYLPKSRILRMVAEDPGADLLTACHLMAVGRIIEQGSLVVVSPGLPRERLERVGLRGARSVAEALEAGRRWLGEGASIAILRDGCKMIPVAPRGP